MCPFNRLQKTAKGFKFVYISYNGKSRRIMVVYNNYNKCMIINSMGSSLLLLYQGGTLQHFVILGDTLSHLVMNCDKVLGMAKCLACRRLSQRYANFCQHYSVSHRNILSLSSAAFCRSEGQMVAL